MLFLMSKFVFSIHMQNVEKGERHKRFKQVYHTVSSHFVKTRYFINHYEKLRKTHFRK